jgi:alpha-amylase/alpha-mannosidase (GH57 family)
MYGFFSSVLAHLCLGFFWVLWVIVLYAWFFSVFGHFYQPPRFNPWSGYVDLDLTAKPYHDWNERVAHECYSRLPEAPLYDSEGWVSDVVNIYSLISFSFGPILLEWLRERFPRVYSAILEADAESISRFGRGSAIAQPYAHIIMPLAIRRYRELSIGWGVRFFEKTFDRTPEGFWLPEAAVDYETLEILVDHGIRFIILAPHQIRAIRVGDSWVSVDRADPRYIYRVILPSGRSIDAVVYHEKLSRGVAFGDLITDGERLARAIREEFNTLSQNPQLVSIAVDGETFGHHRREGVRELAKTLKVLEAEGEVEITNLASHIARNPPALRARIAENTSWSCPHGIERWRRACGCAAEIRPEWRQDWREPLRRAIDMLSSETLKIYDELGREIMPRYWDAAMDYINIVIDRSPQAVADYIEKHISKEPGDHVRAFKLLEALRNTLLAQSSDAWFFEDLARPEPTQILRHSARAIEILEDLGAKGLEERFREILMRALGNTGARGDMIYDSVKRHRIDLWSAGAIYIARSAMTGLGDDAEVYSYRITRSRRERLEIPRGLLEAGIINVESRLTLERETLYYAIITLDGWEFYAGVAPLERPEDYVDLLDLLRSRLSPGSALAVVDAINERFGGGVYTLPDLPIDDQIDIASHMLRAIRRSLRESLQQLSSLGASIASFYREHGLEVPAYFLEILSAYYLLSIEDELSSEKPDLKRIELMIASARSLDLHDVERLKGILRSGALRMLDRAIEKPEEPEALSLAMDIIKILSDLGYSLDSDEAIRSIVASIRKKHYSRFREEAERGDEKAREWVRLFTSLAKILRVRL